MSNHQNEIINEHLMEGGIMENEIKTIMDEATRNYRKMQFDKLLNHDKEYNYSIKITSTADNTFYMDISDEELEAIIELMTKKG